MRILNVESSFIVCLAQEMIIHVLMRRILQVMTTEAIILHQKLIPDCFKDYYLRFQSHFDIKHAVEQYLGVLSDHKR